MITIYKLLSLLLAYPDKELAQHWPDIKQSLQNLDDLTAQDKAGLTGFVDWAASLPLIRLQAEYVNTFDLMAENSLYLTYHLFDEQDRDRGPALVELAELYKATGFAIADGELPDYLPLILEYVATMEEESSARAFLQQTAQAVGIIAGNLEKHESPYAPLLRLIERHGVVKQEAA